jgi:hypothetical protein
VEYVIRAAEVRCHQRPHVAEFGVKAQHVGPTRVVQSLDEAGRSGGDQLARRQVRLPQRVGKGITMAPHRAKQTTLTGQRAQDVGHRACWPFPGRGQGRLDCCLDFLAASRCSSLILEFQCHLPQRRPVRPSYWSFNATCPSAAR